MANKNKLDKAFSILELTVVMGIIAIILAVAIGSQGILRQIRLAKAKQLTKSSPALEFYDKTGENALLAWYDASDEDNFIFASASSFAVEKWLDISGNGNDLTAYAADQRPEWNEDLINDLPALDFERSEADQLSKTGGVFPYNASAGTIVALYALESAAESTLFTQNAGSGDDPITLRIGSDAETEIHTNTTTIVKKALVAEVPYIVVARFVEGSTNLQSCLYTQNSRDCDNTAAIADFHIGATEFIISDSNSSNAADFYLAELMIFGKALNTIEITAIKNYLGKKYNIPVDNDPDLNY